MSLLALPLFYIHSNGITLRSIPADTTIKVKVMAAMDRSTMGTSFP